MKYYFQYDASIENKFAFKREATLNRKESTEQKKVYLLPRHATFIEPPPYEEGFARCFVPDPDITNVDGGEWIVKEDHIGAVYYMPDSLNGFRQRVLGPMPAGSTPEPNPELMAVKQAQDAHNEASLLKGSLMDSFEIKHGGQTYSFSTRSQTQFVGKAFFTAGTANMKWDNNKGEPQQLAKADRVAIAGASIEYLDSIHEAWKLDLVAIAGGDYSLTNLKGI